MSERSTLRSELRELKNKVASKEDKILRFTMKISHLKADVQRMRVRADGRKRARCARDGASAFMSVSDVPFNPQQQEQQQVLPIGDRQQSDDDDENVD